MTKTLTAIVLAKNEEEMIGDALDSLNFADEIIVVDNHSSDRTVEIAREKGARVTSSSLTDFSKLRELPLKKITSDYIFYLDADERVSDKLGKEIVSVINTSQNHKVYRVPRKNFYFEKYPWPKVEHLERLFRRDALLGWYGKLHESPDIKGSVGDLVNPIYHYTHRDLSTMVEKTNLWSETEAKLRYTTKHPRIKWWRFPRVMLVSFWDSYFRQGGYKAGAAGLVESIFQSFSIFITYAKLWEMQNEKNKK